MNTLYKELQKGLKPSEVVKTLMLGNQRFSKNERAQRHLLDQVAETSHGQYPFAAVLSCIDSRVPVELIFDQGIGDIFSIRVAGNVVNEDVLGSLEYSCKVAGAKLILVWGILSAVLLPQRVITLKWVILHNYLPKFLLPSILYSQTVQK